VVVRGRWARVERLLVCRRTDLVVSKIHAPWPGRIATPARAGSSVSQRAQREERGSPVCSTKDQEPLPASEAAGPRGAREAGHRCRLPREFAGAGDRSAADTERIDTEKTGSTLTAFANSDGARESRDCGAVKLLSTQIVCSTGESNFISNDGASCSQGRHQRFPTVRTVAELGNGE
jgi:hypothetical protein